MASSDLLITFVFTTLIFAYIPGPAMIYTTAQTLSRGRRSGLMAALGIHLGGYAHVFAAAAGLTVLFHAVPIIYFGVKLTGAAYLVWLGIQMVRSRADSKEIQTAPSESKSVRRAFFESITVEILNPKTAIFFLAFLPQFIDPTASLPVWLQFVILGTAVNLTFTSADMVCVLLAGLVNSRMKNSGHGQRIIRRIGGVTFIGLGVHLALQKN